MTHEHPIRGLLHYAMHRLPGVPAHAERSAGHQGATHHGSRAHGRSQDHTQDHTQEHTWNHSSARPPRVLVAWQRQVAAFFGQEVS